MKHIADKPHQTGPGRVRNFTQHERETGLHPAIVALHARKHLRDDKTDRRMVEFTRIERGQKA